MLANLPRGGVVKRSVSESVYRVGLASPTDGRTDGLTKNRLTFWRHLAFSDAREKAIRDCEMEPT